MEEMEVEEEMGEPVGTVGMEPIAYAAKEGRATEVEVATVAGEGMEASGSLFERHRETPRCVYRPRQMKRTS